MSGSLNLIFLSYVICLSKVLLCTCMHCAVRPSPTTVSERMKDTYHYTNEERMHMKFYLHVHKYPSSDVVSTWLSKAIMPTLFCFRAIHDGDRPPVTREDVYESRGPRRQRVMVGDSVTQLSNGTARCQQRVRLGLCLFYTFTLVRWKCRGKCGDMPGPKRGGLADRTFCGICI
ncbi:uncharacterized protein LOC143174754 isoform X2 [Nomia melanderi]|uniref:uncharacterized protein LOC143174754 isoform X2 n=1 Tax=Nomia melanderi TaxID=2448451 RepID=UPI003FCC523F